MRQVREPPARRARHQQELHRLQRQPRVRHLRKENRNVRRLQSDRVLREKVHTESRARSDRKGKPARAQHPRRIPARYKQGGQKIRARAVHPRHRKRKRLLLRQLRAKGQRRPLQRRRADRLLNRDVRAALQKIQA